ncbi:MAG TPA: hypothetical protein PKK43_15825, partial [Spirochaetota bacterium]|nr:hypothetical protein [Spirochaetota bacterium]
MRPRLFYVIVPVISAILLVPALHLIAGDSSSSKIDESISVRIELPSPCGGIRNISVDSRRRYLVAATSDKSVKLYDASSMKYIRTLGIPTGPEYEGIINSAVISPDGSIIACGGWTGYNKSTKFSVYIFDRSSGKMIRRITGQPETINTLQFSPNGEYLAIGSKSSDGIRLYGTSDWTFVASEADYADRCSDISFAQSGRFATVSADGNVRLYSNQGILLKKTMLRSNNPYKVSITDDGSMIAVIYVDMCNIDVYSGGSL